MDLPDHLITEMRRLDLQSGNCLVVSLTRVVSRPMLDELSRAFYEALRIFDPNILVLFETPTATFSALRLCDGDTLVMTVGEHTSAQDAATHLENLKRLLQATERHITLLARKPGLRLDKFDIRQMNAVGWYHRNQLGHVPPVSDEAPAPHPTRTHVDHPGSPERGG